MLLKTMRIQARTQFCICSAYGTSINDVLSKEGGRGVKTCFLRSPQKFDKISQFCVDVKAKLEDFVNFCGLLGKYKLYPKIKVHKPYVMNNKIRGG